MTTPNIATAKFTSTSATTGRTWGDRCADIINVLDYGADPTNTNDSTASIQAAFDAAFGSSGSPHGSASATSNRPVFIPNGQYKISSGPLTLTRIVGGHIFGAGPGATQLLSAAGGTILSINGAANIVVENLNLDPAGQVGTCIDLDWDGTSGGDGLHHNIFRDLVLGDCSTGTVIRIAKSASGGGNNNLFQSVALQNVNGVGIKAEASTATDNVVIGGGTGGSYSVLYWSAAGSIHCIETSPINNVGTGYDFQIDSGYPVAIIGGRSESRRVLKVTSGFVTMRAFTQAYGGVGTNGEMANITGGKVIIDVCSRQNGDTISDINGTAATTTGSSISGATLTIGTVTAGIVAIGQIVSGAGIPGNSGTDGSAAPYIVSGSGSTWTLNYAPGNVGPIAITCGGKLYLRGTVIGGSLTGFTGTIAENI